MKKLLLLIYRISQNTSCLVYCFVAACDRRLPVGFYMEKASGVCGHLWLPTGGVHTNSVDGKQVSLFLSWHREHF